MAVRSIQLWTMTILSTDILQGSVATHLKGGGIFLLSLYCTFTAKSDSKRILKIAQPNKVPSLSNVTLFVV